MWTETFSGSNDGSAYDVIETFDHGIISTGYYNSGGMGTNMFLYKTDSAGNFMWMHEYGGNNAETGFTVRQLSDSGYVTAGFTNSHSTGNEDVYLVRTNAAGSLIWNKTYSHSSDDRANSLALTNDGGFIMTGQTDAVGGTGYDIILIKTDSSGNLSWAKRFATASNETGNSVQQTSDGGYIIAGTFTQSNSDDAFLLKTDSVGNLMWTKKYDYLDHDNANKVLIIPTGGFILTGSTTASAIQSSSFLSIMTDDSGNVIWSKTYGGNDGNIGHGLVKANDGGYVMTGLGELYSNLLVVKIDSMGDSGCNDSIISVTVDTTAFLGSPFVPNVSSAGTSVVTTPSTTSGGTVTTLCLLVEIPEYKGLMNGLSIYPNPATKNFTIENKNKTGLKSVLIVNQLGKIIFRDNFENTNEVIIDAELLATGLYNVIVINDSDTYMKKLMIHD
jgi:hypothetical protein